jgi:hypothetical protein
MLATRTVPAWPPIEVPEGVTFNHAPPPDVDGDAVQFNVPKPGLDIATDCAGGADPPESGVKFRLFCESWMELEFWLTTTLTVTTALPVLAAPVIVTLAVFKPGLRPAELIVNPTIPGDAVDAEPESLVVSQDWSELELNPRVPLPVFRTVICPLVEAPCVRAKLSDKGVAERFGGAAGKTVRVTGTVNGARFPAGVMVTVPLSGPAVISPDVFIETGNALGVVALAGTWTDNQLPPDAAAANATDGVLNTEMLCGDGAEASPSLYVKVREDGDTTTEGSTVRVKAGWPAVDTRGIKARDDEPAYTLI